MQVFLLCVRMCARVRQLTSVRTHEECRPVGQASAQTAELVCTIMRKKPNILYNAKWDSVHIHLGYRSTFNKTQCSFNEHVGVIEARSAFETHIVVFFLSDQI